MITRDSAASLSGTAQNARQRLGELIDHYMRERDVDDLRAARTCSASVKDVERWRLGEQVPSPEQWAKLKRSVNHAFGRFADLYQRARKEADDEARERAAKSMTPTTKINSALGDKLAAVAAVPAIPAPVIELHKEPSKPMIAVVPDEPERKYKPRKPTPPGAFGAVAIAKRAEFVRNVLRQRPNARTQGNDSIVELVRATFGVGISPDAIAQLRSEVAAECRSPNTHEREPVEIKVPIDAPPNQAQIEHERASTGGGHSGDIETAVQLILEALPQLQTFTIAVDEHGEASVDYQIRKVVITTDGGSFKVRR